MSRKLLLVFTFVLLAIGGSWISTPPAGDSQSRPSAHVGALPSLATALTSWHYFLPAQPGLRLNQSLFPPLIHPSPIESNGWKVLFTPTTTTTTLPPAPQVSPVTSPPAPSPPPVTIPAVVSPSVATPPPASSGDCGLGNAANVVRAEAAGIPCSWVPTAVCEEQGEDDPDAGYFGIQEWHGYDGYPTAGSAPLSVQQAWEVSVGQDHAPDAPGQCAGY